MPISAEKAQDGTLEDLISLGCDRRKEVIYFYSKTRTRYKLYDVTYSVLNDCFFPGCSLPL